MPEQESETAGSPFAMLQTLSLQSSLPPYLRLNRSPAQVYTPSPTAARSSAA